MTKAKLPPHPPEEPWHVHQPFPPHHHHFHDEHHVAPECDDQLAVFSGVGRGLRGDGYKVVIKSDVEAETYLEGMIYDAATNTYSSDWISENINGGKLMYQYNLRPSTVPQTFTITFRYVRPNRSESEWVWTTPAIPYIWDADDDGLADVDGIIGVGVGTLFMKKTSDPTWVTTNLPTSYEISETVDRQEKLLYPDGWTRDMFNAPVPGDPWTVNLQYGIGGDIDAPNIEDLAKILGVNVDFLRDLVENRDLPGSGDTFGTKGNGDPMNTKEYIDSQNDGLLDHIHEDMGFGDILINDGDADTQSPKRNTIKKWFDWIIGKLGFGDLINSFGNSGATTVKGYIDWIINKLGFGSDIDQFGGGTITNLKSYIDSKESTIVNNIINQTANPKLYKKTYDIKMCFYDLTNYTKPVGSFLIDSLVANSTPTGVVTAKLYISYFDILPMIEFDMEVNTGQSHGMPTGEIGIACTGSSGNYTPLDLSGVSLPNRSIALKPPLLNPENLTNVGYSSATDGNWQVYAGVGDLVSKDASSDAWPWGSNNNAIFYIFNRWTGSTGPNLSIDYARTYNCSYNQATLG